MLPEEEAMRLGFALQVLGRPGLKASDTRRWQNDPHLSVSLAYLRDIFAYLHQVGVRMYRMSSDLAPYVTHPALPRFHSQIADCADELAAVGELARDDGLRLSLHPGAHVVLNSPDVAVAERAMTELRAQASILDHMGLGPEAVIVTHAGGVYGDKRAAMSRFVQRYEQLDEPARRRIVLENDDRSYTLGDTYEIHRQTAIRLVFDVLHHLCNPTPGMALEQAAHLALTTWPETQTPKVHYSSPSTCVRLIETRNGSGRRRRLRLPRTAQHADLIDPFAFAAFLCTVADARPFDVMLECKGKDLALLRLRRQLARLAPELVAHLAIT
jgi:UV DNA damage endonuclease